MEFEQITTQVTDHVLTITLNRPDRLNAWTPTMFGELIAESRPSTDPRSGSGPR
jgi:enoyl-CoA hydratase/carnithine racemase